MVAKLAKNTQELYMCRAIYCCLLLVFSSYTHAEQPCDNLSQLSWLEGHWLNETEKSRNIEHWTRVSPTTVEGEGKVFDIQGMLKTQESLRLVQMNGDIFYIAKVSHNHLPIAFKAVSCGVNTVTFKNNQHDFPNQLTYKIEQNRLVVGVKDNKGKGFTITFERKQD